MARFACRPDKTLSGCLERLAEAHPRSQPRNRPERVSNPLSAGAEFESESAGGDRKTSEAKSRTAAAYDPDPYDPYGPSGAGSAARPDWTRLPAAA